MSAEDPTYEERFAAWLPTGRREGEETWLARARFHTIEYYAQIALIRQRSRPAPVPFVPLVDDGLADSKWRKKNPDRRYRVRPWRKVDGQPATYHYPCFTVIDVIAKRGPAGIPISALHDIGFAIQPEDSDAFAELVMLAFAASRGFRNKRPGFAG